MLNRPISSDTDVETAPATKKIAEFVCSVEVDEVARTSALRAIVDTVAVTAAGGVEPAVQTFVRSFTPHSDAGVPSLWTSACYRPDDAALIYGMASHILDYDDVSMLATCHPSVPVLSACLCALPWREISGRDLADAFSVGTEVMIRHGQAMGFRHYELGFHATATLGVIGAAAAVARLRRLDPMQTTHALAIAASLSSGLRKNFGSMVKSLHVGLAASNGLKAADWAGAGITGAAEVFDHDGFLQAFSGGETDVMSADVIFGRPFVIAEPGFEQKRYPCCYMLHKMIEATLSLVREAGVGLSDVRSARVETPRGGTKPLIHPFPKTGLNALFSAPYAVVASLLDGRIDLKSFTNDAVLRAEVQSRLHDIEVVEIGDTLTDGDDVGGAPVTVTLKLRDGNSLCRTIHLSPGSQQDPLTTSQLEAKWTDCLRRANPAVSDAVSGRLFAQGLDLAAAPRISDWLLDLRSAVAPR